MNMNTTPEQLRLAADILEKGLPYEYYSRLSEQWTVGIYGPLHYLDAGNEIRIKPPSFAPIPDGAERHNPDGLTPEQVGERWRLLVATEVDHRFHSTSEFWRPRESRFISHQPSSGVQGAYHCDSDTIRVPLSTPYPDGSFVKDGKLVKPWVPKFKVGDRVRQIGDNAVWEVKGIENEGFTLYRLLDNGYHATCWRKNEQLEPAPWTLTRHIPGFRPLRDGEHWHRTDWTEEMLPEGWRPHLLGERQQEDDEWRWGNGWKAVDTTGQPAEKSFNHRRTRRPLPEPQPEPPKVPLGPDDVPPGSAIRWPHCNWVMVSNVCDSYAVMSNGDRRHWKTLMDGGATIHRPGNLDPNGKPVWEPCHKEGALS